jgi:hypothetical protein
MAAARSDMVLDVELIEFFWDEDVDGAAKGSHAFTFEAERIRGDEEEDLEITLYANTKSVTLTREEAVDLRDWLDEQLNR